MKYFNRIRTLFFLLLFILFIVVYKLSLLILPYNPVSLSTSEKINLLSVMPEGWAFFTKDPRQEIFFVYSETEKKWTRVNVPGSSFGFDFGLNRKGRAITAEMEQLLIQIPDSIWKPINTPIENYLQSITQQKEKKILFEVFDKCPNPQCLNHIVFMKTKLAPWAWAKLRSKIIMPSQIAEIYVHSKKEN